ncbi:MAG: AAA family ATPase [Bacteroidetes bacterium]|nr:AAA family ATPase [Bacteroidota bacterium]
MNQIKNIEIKNFKSIRHQTIDDCKRINVFIGYPNVGKSNILEAMSLISYFDHNNYLPYKNLCRFKELIDIFSDGDKQKDAEVFTSDYVFSLRFINQNQIDFAIITKEDYKEKFNHRSSPLLRNIRIDKTGKIDEIVKIVATNHEFQILKKYHFKTENIVSKNNPIVLDFPFGTNLPEVIRHNSSLRKECGELFSEYNLKLAFDDEENLFIQKQLDEYSVFQFSFSQVADTLQRLIFHKAAIATNKNSVLLFEEPEAHMFPPYISKLTGDIWYNKENQYFITTHSPVVVNDFLENARNELAIYVVDYEKKNGETIIKRMSDAEMHEAYQYGLDLFLNVKSFVD